MIWVEYQNIHVNFVDVDGARILCAISLEEIISQ